MRAEENGKPTGPRPAAFFILAAPFYLNDLANIWVHNFAAWLAIDYFLVKGFVLAAAALMLRRGVVNLADLGFKRLSCSRFAAWTLGMTAAGLVLDQYAYDLLAWLPAWKLGGYPGEPGAWLYTFDLWFGLALVALTEEFVFRGLAWNVFRPRMSAAAVYVVSAALFGLIHWSLGLPAIVSTALIGAAFMLCVHRTGSIWPTMAAHFIVNLVFFW